MKAPQSHIFNPYIAKILAGQDPTAMDFVQGPSRSPFTPGINPMGSNPQQAPGLGEKAGGMFGKIDSFLGKPGGMMLMNLLAQQGYSTMPQSKIGAVGRAALMTQQQQAGQSAAEAKRKLMEAQGKYYTSRASGESANPASANVQSVFTDQQGNINIIRRNGDIEPTKYKEGVNARVVDGPAGSKFVVDGRSGERIGQLVTQEAAIAGEADLALATGEAGRGRVYTPETTDDTGVLKPGGFKAVPGSQAAVTEEDAGRSRLAGGLMKSIQSQTVVEDISRLNKQIKAGTVPFGRAAAAYDQMNPVLQPQGYRDAKSLIESVKGNVGIDSLLRIKQTGAGLGQVPQSQLDLLSRLLGELNMNQSKDQFVETWNRMGKVYQTIWDAADEEMRALGAMPPEVFDQLNVGPSAQQLIDEL